MGFIIWLDMESDISMRWSGHLRKLAADDEIKDFLPDTRATVSISSQSAQLLVCLSGPRHCISDEHVPVVSLQPAPDLELCLLCWVHGEDHNSIFPVNISVTETIGALKKEIRKEMEPDFDDIPMGALKLWKVSASDCRCEPLLSLS